MTKNRTVLMIGDSITAGFDVKKYFPDETIINKGVSGDSTTECQERISAEWFTAQPQKIFLCIGTNDLARSRTDQLILANIRFIIELLRKLSEHSTIYLTTLFPTRNNPPRPNERINGFNSQLQQLSAALGCKYLDLHRYFVDAEGMLKKECTDDGLHLTEEGYRLWSSHLSELLRS